MNTEMTINAYMRTTYMSMANVQTCIKVYIDG